MPPEGYTTVTLPDELAQELADIGDGSPARGVRLLLADSDGVGDDLRDLLERVEDAAATAEKRTGRIERTLEDIGAGR